MDLTAALAGLLLGPILETVAGDQPVDELARTLGVGGGVGAPSDELRPIRDASRFWCGVATRSRDPCMGLHAAVRTGVRGLGLIECIARVAPTFGDAVDRGIRYVPLLGDRAAVELVRDRDTARLVVRTTIGLPFPRHAADFALASIVLVIRRLLGDGLVSEVRFVHTAAPDTAAEYHRVLRAPVRFGATMDEVRFPASLLERRLSGSDERTWGYLDCLASDRLASLVPEPDFDSRLGRAYSAAIECGDASIQAISRRLAMSPRTLQRRLRASGTSHRNVLEATRHELAVAHLRQSDQTIEVIAARLGYSEPSTFARAFRRRAGTSPGAYRERATPVARRASHVGVSGHGEAIDGRVG